MKREVGRGRNGIQTPVVSLHPGGIGVSTGPDKADRQLRGDEFKGADVADGSIADGRYPSAV